MLSSHSGHPSLAVSSVEARVIGMDENWLCLRWRIEGSTKLYVPGFAGRGRSEDLWKTTCFELFLKPSGGTAYVELNLSPSERWAAYDFSDYREGMTDRSIDREPTCTMRLGSSFAIFDAAIPAARLPALPWQIGLSAVIEEEGGVISYWALAHPDGKPDFHHPACFAATLEAPRST